MENLTVNRWKIESIRLTSFSDQKIESNKLERWLTQIGKGEPLQVNKGITNFLGLIRLDTSILKLEWKNQRFDLILLPDNPEIENIIGSFSEFQQFCNNYTRRFFEIEDCPSSNRLALGVNLIIPISNNEEGISIVQEMLISVNELTGCGDFLFRINWPTSREIAGGISINRLTTWTIGAIQLMRIQANTNIVEPVNSQLTLRLEMDLNTATGITNIFVLDEQKKIFNELVEIAYSIAANGEHNLKDIRDDHALNATY